MELIMGKRFYDFNLSDTTNRKEFHLNGSLELKKTFYKFYPKVYNFVCVFIAEKKLAEKITENVMLDFWHNRNSYVIKGNTDYYLASKVLDCIKKLGQSS
jgi:hypothetical protein